MKNVRLTLASCALATFVGCSDYSGGEQISAEQQENREEPNFGSATDIAVGNGDQRSTNELNAADIGVGGPQQGEAGNYQSQPLQGQNSDGELEKKIKVALTTGSMGTTGVIAEDELTKIDVQVQDGVVTLSGPVASEAEKKSIEDRVNGFKGVRQVQNNLTITGRGLSDEITEPFVPRGPGTE